MATLQIKKGTSSTLNNVSQIDGQLLFTTDNSNIYLDDASFGRIYLGGGYGLKSDGQLISIEGDLNTYYPVKIYLGNSNHFGLTHIHISRQYNMKAPAWASTGTSNPTTHPGGLTLSLRWTGDTAWGGNSKSIIVDEFNEMYTTMVAGMQLSTDGLIVWLRGGGAFYYIDTDYGKATRIDIYYDTYTASNNATFPVRTGVEKVETEINSKWGTRNGSLYSDGHPVLTTNNYTNYAVSKTGTAAKATADANGAVISSTYLKYSGGTMTGQITIGQGDGKGIQLGTNGRINATSANTTQATVCGINGTSFYSGHSDFALVLRGSATRPTYNGAEIYTTSSKPTYSDVGAPSTTGTNASGTWGISISGNSATATIWQNARTLTIGNKAQSVNGSGNVTWLLHDILYNPTAIGTASSWNITTPGVYPVASGSAFTGTANPESANGGLTPYRYGQLIVSRAGTSGMAQFYISHNDSGGSAYGIKYRTGWNSSYVNTWNTLLDSLNYTNYTVTKTGSGASGTWGINITGNAGTASQLINARTFQIADNDGTNEGPTASFNGTANTILNLPSTIKASLSGTATNAYFLSPKSDIVYGRNNLQYFNASLSTTASATENYAPTADWYHIIRMNHGNTDGYYVELAACFHADNFYLRRVASGTNFGFKHIWVEGNSITGAVWNDYAECRESDCQEFGRVLVENGDDTLSISTERLQPFAGVSSDTWGFCQGETEKAKTPIAVAGRVLVYPYRDRNEYKPGDVVCAAPNGTVDIMTPQEEMMYPSRIVGTVSCVPDYEEWGSGDRDPVKVNGRIWIKVK